MDFSFGVDYYPEHWPRSRWETDARMMREMGIEVVRMAEFSWFKMEPEEGRFEFEWLDDAIDVLAREGIKTILGTPTAAPPAWIIERNPEIQPVDSFGNVHHFGGRHHDCQSNLVYREHVRRFVTAFAKHFGENPNVIGWQVDNELGNSHGDLCHCESCRRRFQEWLKEKYGTIENLNEKWGTAFWSQGYNTFEQIPTPMRTASGGKNPSAELDWKRFCSDLVIEFHDLQAGIIRRYSPGRFITQNMMGFSDKFSYYKLAEELEFSSHDQYPGGHFNAVQNVMKDAELSAALSFIRSTKDAPFAIMEQQSSITGWEVLGRAPAPGQLALWSMQSVANGADAVIYFRWRSCMMGTEQYWHGLLPHSGIPKRNYREIEAFMHKTKPLMQEIKGAMPPKEAAILFSYEQEYAMQIQPHHPDLNYVDHLMTYYKALHRRNIPADFIPEGRDMSPYKMIIAPLWYLTNPESSESLREYVQNGGTLVLTMRSGIKDEYNLCLTDKPLPAGLDDLTGIEVDEYDSLLQTDAAVVWDGKEYPCTKWCDIMHTNTAEPVAAYGKYFYAGTPAITKNSYGKGTVWYIGTEMGEELALRFIDEAAKAANLQSLGCTAAGVELKIREKDGKSWLFALNHTDEEQKISVPEGFAPRFEGQTGTLPPYGTEVYVK